MCDEFGDDFIRFEHATKARLAAGLVAACWSEDRDSVAAQGGNIAAGRRVFPHLAVHRRRHQQRAIAGEGQCAQQIIGEAIGELGDEISRCRRNQQRIGVARKVDVRHVIGDACIPLVGENRLARKRLESDRRHEAAGCFGHRHLYAGTLFGEQANEFCRLIGSDATRDAKKNAFPR